MVHTHVRLVEESAVSPAGHAWCPYVDVSQGCTYRFCGREAGWRLERVDMDVRYEVQPTAAQLAPQFASGFGSALIAVAVRL